MSNPNPDDTPNLPARLRWAMERRNFSQEKLAEKAGCSQASIQKVLAGRTQKSKFLPDIARALNVELDWLELGLASSQVQAPRAQYSVALDGGPVELGLLSPWDDETPLEHDEVELPLYKEVELSSGHGRTAVQITEGRKVRFSRKTLRDAGVDVANAACGTNSGNSNFPLILPRATLGIDQGMRRIVDGKIYALEHGGLFRVKFLYRLPNGGIRMRSYNRDEYPDEDYTFDQVMEQSIQILGRIFWWSSLDPISAPPML